MRDSIESYKTFNPELYVILKQSRIYQDKIKRSFNKLVMTKVSLELPEIIKDIHRQQNEIIRSFGKLVKRRWQNNQTIEGYEFYNIFKELYEDIDINIFELGMLKNSVQHRLQNGRKQQSYQEALQMIENYQKELNADKKKAQKVKSAWKTVLAGYEDEECQE